MTRNELIFSDEWLSITIENTIRSDRAIKTMRDELFSQLSKMRDEWVDAAREDEAVGFAEWTHIRGYEMRLGGKWAKYYKREEGGDYTTKELYQLYLKHKNEKL